MAERTLSLVYSLQCSCMKEQTSAMAKATKTNKGTAANVGYEAELWQMADALRGSMDAAEYKHVVLGLIFLKYISDAFEEQHAKLEKEKAQGADAGNADGGFYAHARRGSIGGKGSEV